MPLKLYPDIYASGTVPPAWSPVKGGTIKYNVRNRAVRRALSRLLTGAWKKVVKRGTGGEVHYIEHTSGRVAGVKYLPGRQEA